MRLLYSPYSNYACQYDGKTEQSRSWEQDALRIIECCPGATLPYWPGLSALLHGPAVELYNRQFSCRRDAFVQHADSTSTAEFAVERELFTESGAL